MFKALQTAASSAYLRAGAVIGLAAAPLFAHADTAIDTIMDSVDLSGITVKVVAAALLIVGIALAFKGPDLGKRVVRKV